MVTAEKLLSHQEKIAVVGLGYVGLPLAVAFSEQVPVIGFDTNADKIQRYKNGIDPTNEVGAEILSRCTVAFTANEARLREAAFIIVAVPTPVNKSNMPDLAPLEGACRVVGRNLSRGAVVMFESTVYPGTTEDICIPILEETSGLVCKSDFSVGYSPERINPGDHVHRLENIPKIVSGIDEKTAELAAQVYGWVVKAGIHIAGSIKVAEVAKLAENAQRDVNIAFMNELAMTLDRLDIRTSDVLMAMNTKWNALGFRPGLVGGHCISVDPYYLIQKAEEVNGQADLVRMSRRTNNKMGQFTADVIVRQIIKAGYAVQGARVFILGVTYKENCPDIRNTMIPSIAERLKEYGVGVQVCDPVADKQEVLHTLGVRLVDLDAVREADCVVLAVGHQAFKVLGPDGIKKLFRTDADKARVVIDIPSVFPRQALQACGFLYWSL